MPSDLAEAWSVNAAMTMLLFDAVPEGGMEARYSPRTRTVAAQFAHLHSVRVAHLQARGRRHGAGLAAFPRGAEPTPREIRAALVASEPAVAAMLDEFAAKGKVPSWQGPPASFLGYLCAHEGHHRGLAIVCLRQSGVKLPKEVVYGIWDWGRARK